MQTPDVPGGPGPATDDPFLDLPRDHGWIAPDLAEEHPGLDLFSWTTATAWPSRKSPWAKDWLARLSTRVDGPAVLGAHREEAPGAHRRFLQRIGRDPAEDRSPQEAAYHARIKHGGFPVRGAPHDVLLIALLETGVPIWAVDADGLQGGLGLRRSLAGELGDPDEGPDVPPDARREPVVVDDAGVVAEVCRPPRAAHRATKKTARTTFFCVRVPGLSDLRVDEAVWMVRSLSVRAD